MKKQKIAKYLIILITIILVVGLIYSIVKYKQTGNQTVNITTGNNYYLDSKLEAVVNISSKKIIEEGNINVRLLDSEEKKVKGIKSKYELDQMAMTNITLDIPQDLEAGKYYLEVTAKTNLGKDKVKKAIQIQNNKDANINVTFDKGIYKPGDTVNFRTLLTYIDDDKPIQEDVKISIYDGNENRVYILNSKTSDYGIISGKFTLANEVNSGTYKLKVETKGQEYIKSFVVNPYVTPKYGVEITSDKETYLVGETAKITVKAEYFFGEKVKDAVVLAKIDSKEFNGKTNENGEFTFDYTVNNVGKFNAQATVVDTSNYMVEEVKSISVGTDIFEIEVLPEYGQIINSIDNEIYIFTKKADGTNVKTYVDVTFGKVKRQVIVDENGIGKFLLNASDIENNQSISELKISAQDMDGNVVNKNEKIQIVNNYGTVISTDKVKYDVKDDITIKVNSSNNSENIICICKNDKVLKMTTTTEEEIDVNLEDTYGLIDIYVLNNKSSNPRYYDDYYYTNSYQPYTSNKISCQKTIFIKPDKQLNIEINTDSEEYKPKDTMTINMNLTDEKNSNIDAALLVSILDEAILNLADNDISIDNIKLALSDIEFSEDLDAATLYANIINDSSESTLMGLLLKQNQKNNIINNNGVQRSVTKYEYEGRAYLFGFILTVFLIIIGIIKSKKIREALSHVLSLLMITIISMYSIGQFLYHETDLYEASAMLIAAIAAILMYVLIFYKNKKYLVKCALQYLTTYIIFGISMGLLVGLLECEYEISMILAISIIPILYTIIVVLKRNGRKVNKLEKVFKVLLKCEIIAVISILLFKEYCLIVILILDYIYEKVLKKKINKEEIKEKTNNEKANEVVGYAVATVIVILIIVGILNTTKQFSGSIDSAISTGDSMMSQDITNSRPNINAGDSWQSIAPEYDVSMKTESGSSSSNIISGIFDSAESIMDSSVSKNENSDYKEEAFVEENASKEEENIRNVFLESLCFIPELVSKNGKVQEQIKLSDNITTWQIQVVGNTKNGKVGFASDSFKVFKEFFVDFSMPTNTIVGDKISIPATIYNYTETPLTIELNVKEDAWFKLDNYEKNITVNSKETKLVYIPIEILSAGENKLRIEAKSNELTDIVEKTMTTEENGIKISKVIASGSFEDKLDLDVLYLQNYKEGTGKLRVKLYATAMSQAVEGIENILKMPTGCFEQVSSSLYPDALVLKYLQNRDDVDEQLKQKALNYIETGYQKLLTYEVKGEKGGYSLYGHSPAELVLTSYGLMEFKEISEVYEVEEKVIENMKNYILKNQKVDGSFDIKRSSYGIVNSSNELALNAYITWTLSEVFPEEEKLEKSVEYLENKLDEVEDNYTLALMANVFANTKSKKTNIVINKLIKNIQNANNGTSYLTSNVTDYYGTRRGYQNLQTTALASLALTKANSNAKTNLGLINYIVSQKDQYGTWGTTQATILSLKALVEYEGKTTIKEQEIKLKLNKEEKTIKVEKDNLDIYQEVFENVQKENNLKIELEKGKLYYEVIQEYYIDYSEYDIKENKLDINYTIDSSVKVNDTLKQKIKIANTSGEDIANGMVEISIPQGCSVKEESLSKLETYGQIEKYEYSYGKIYLYIRNFANNSYIDIDVEYKADYPATINGASVKVYDYYNPDIKAITMPTLIEIK